MRYNRTGTQAPPPIAVNTGFFHVVFDSDAIQTDEGFSLTYSVGEITFPKFLLP